MTPWRDLETKGYAVLPGAFGSAEVAALVHDFERGAPPQSYPHGFKLVGRRALAAIRPRIDSLLAEIREATSLRVDTVNFLTFSHYVTTRLADKVSHLHQDFDIDYQLTGDHVHYLNFWLPIIKPERERSNLRVVGLDTLPPEVRARLEGGGGRRIACEGGRTFLISADERFTLDIDLEEYGTDLFTSAGDLVVLRGDIPHRTQDVETLRVAASIRATASAKLITRRRARVDDPRIQEMLDRCFESRGEDSISIGEFVDFSQGKTR